MPVLQKRSYQENKYLWPIISGPFTMKLLYNIALIIVIAMTFPSSCVERYHPDEMYLRPGLLVFNPN